VVRPGRAIAANPTERYQPGGPARKETRSSAAPERVAKWQPWNWVTSTGARAVVIRSKASRRDPLLLPVDVDEAIADYLMVRGSARPVARCSLTQ
jgi:hypothetical protein